MCLLVAGNKVSDLNVKTLFDDAFHIHQDGCGVAYRLDGKTVLIRDLMTARDAQMAWASLPKDSPFLLHFRFGTSGVATSHNVHPFPLMGGGFAHNGVLTCYRGNERDCDTRQMVGALDRFKINPSNPDAAPIIEAMLDNGRGAFMDCNGKISIFNSHLWTKEKDVEVWFSNKSHENSYSFGGSSYADDYHWTKGAGSFKRAKEWTAKAATAALKGFTKLHIEDIDEVVTDLGYQNAQIDKDLDGRIESVDKIEKDYRDRTAITAWNRYYTTIKITNATLDKEGV